MKSLIDTVPSDWYIQQVRFFSNTYSGGTPLRNNEQFYTGNINWVKSSELKNKYLYDTEEHISEEAIKKSSARYVEPDTILFAMYGATAGDICILKTKSTTNQAVLAIPINKNEIINEYLYYQLKYKTEKLKFITQGGGQPNLSKGIVDKTPISYPQSFAEQKAIAGILAKVDEAIESVEKSIKAAERLKKSLMQNLLTGKLKLDGTWRSEDEFIDTSIGLIPKGWRLVKAKDLCLKVTDGTHDTPSPSQEGYPLVTSKNLKYNGVDFDGCYLVSREDYVEINKRSKVDQYDILFGMIGTVGNPQVVTQNPVEFAIKNVGLFKTNGDKQLSIWIKNYLSSNMFEIYKFKQQAGTTQQFVSLGFLRKIPIPLPHKNDEVDYKQVQEINLRIKGIIDILSAKEKKLDSLKTLKRSLMQNLLTGKVRVDVEKTNTLLEEV